MKYFVTSIVIMTLLLGWGMAASAITIYFTDGTRLEVDSVTRIENSVCLFVDISKIDTARTNIKELQPTAPAVQKGLTISKFDITPSDDGSELFITGDVTNNSEHPLKNVRVIVTLKDKQDQKLLTIQGYVGPEKLSPGQTSTFRLQVNKPQGFWGASAEVKGETLPQ